MYDLLNFASEMATHRATPLAGRHLQAYIGSLISDEFDMEGTAQTDDGLYRFLREGSDGRSER